MEDHRRAWPDDSHWIEGLDAWIADHATGAGSPLTSRLGRWQRDPYRRFDMDSPAYQDMVFFHPFVRRVFFDMGESAPAEAESMLRVYKIPLEPLAAARQKLIFEAEDARHRRSRVEVTDLRLFLFANGIGILSIGVEARRIPLSEALWINEMMRKVYPSSGRQLREGRTPRRFTLMIQDEEGNCQTVSEEIIQAAAMRGFLPPLSRLTTELLYFANYQNQEFEPVLDERMIVYTFMSVDRDSVPEGYEQSEDYEILMSRLLYVDRWGETYRYEAEFTREQMREHVYRRWAHQGTLYGFTSYSNVTLTIGKFDCDEHELREGFLVHRMFRSRYYLTVIVALFYRASLLDFSERTALVARRLYRSFESARTRDEDIRLAFRLMFDFQHFATYWYFSELANKDEEIEHFQMQCRAYRLDPMKTEIEQEAAKMNEIIERGFQQRNTESINRLAMLSMILGGGAVLTGFFGMNFGREFDQWVFNPVQQPWLHYGLIGLVSFIVLASFFFGVYLIAANWNDYEKIMLPKNIRSQRERESLRRTSEWNTEEEEETE